MYIHIHETRAVTDIQLLIGIKEAQFLEQNSWQVEQATKSHMNVSGLNSLKNE